MLNAMHARHIIFRSFSASFRSDQLNSSLLIDERVMRSRWLVEWCWAIVEAERVKNRCENSGCWCESAIISKQLRILLRILLTNLYAFDLQTSCCSAISHLFSTLLSLHSSVRSSNSLWRCFWHDSALHASQVLTVSNAEAIASK